MNQGASAAEGRRAPTKISWSHSFCDPLPLPVYSTCNYYVLFRISLNIKKEKKKIRENKRNLSLSLQSLRLRWENKAARKCSDRSPRPPPRSATVMYVALSCCINSRVDASTGWRLFKAGPSCGTHRRDLILKYIFLPPNFRLGRAYLWNTECPNRYVQPKHAKAKGRDHDMF